MKEFTVFDYRYQLRHTKTTLWPMEKTTQRLNLMNDGAKLDCVAGRWKIRKNQK